MDGLNKQEIEYRINNNLVNSKKINTQSNSYKKIIIKNTLTFFNFMNIILFILILTTGSIKNGLFIIAVAINTLIGIHQEVKAKKIIDRLKFNYSNEYIAIRNRLKVLIKKNEILLDDILLLKEGDNLCVDIEILSTDYCEVDESILSGESESIIKSSGDKILAGSIITSGSVIGRVISINDETYANKLLHQTYNIKNKKSYLSEKFDVLLKIISFIIVPIGILLFISQFIYNNQTYTISIISSVAGVIGMIPDGLIILLSISLTIGIIKMANLNVIVQDLYGVELISTVDTFCFDKTGTITDGSMDVIEYININNLDDSLIHKITYEMVKNSINSTEKALINYIANKNNSIKLEIGNRKTFSSKRKYSYMETSKGNYALGAIEFISSDYKKYNDLLSKYINNGYRIIALAKCNNKFDIVKNRVEALYILKDGIRKNIIEVFNYLEREQINYKILSGDNKDTIVNILKQIKEFNVKAINGYELPSDKIELKNIVLKYNVFGRLTSVQKKEIIEILQDDNKNVAMIGDGVNDLLALKTANCSITLRDSVNAAKDVSQIIIANDFNVLIDIIKEGRRVINNIQKAASMFLVKTTYSFLLSLMCIVFGLKYPFLPIQLTLISILCVGIPSFFLSLEPNENKIQDKFIIRIFENSLSSGFCVFLDYVLLVIVNNFSSFIIDDIRTIMVITTGIISIELIYNLSKPLNKRKKLILISSIIAFIFTITLFNDFFMISNINYRICIMVLYLSILNLYFVYFIKYLYNLIFKLRKK